jgi:O-antigen/teichoic acid export membrane protein
VKRGLLWSVVATVCGVVGSLFVTPLLLSRLGPAEFGLYVLVLTVAAYASFFDFGLTWAAGRYFADDVATGRRGDLVGRFFTLTYFLAGVGLLSVAGAVVVGPALLRHTGTSSDGAVVAALVLAAASFALTLQINLAGTLLRGCQRFDEAGRVNTIGSVLLPLGSYVAMRLGASLNLLLAVNVLINVVVLTLYVLRSRHELRTVEPTPRWSPRYLREMASFGGWSMSTRACGIVVLQVDRLAVAFLGSITALTYYSVPASVASRVNAIGGAVAGSFFTRASALHAAGSRAALRRQHAAATRLLVWVAVSAAAPLVLLGDEFLRAWIGPEMAAHGGPVLLVLVLGYAVMAVGALDAVTLEGCGRPDLSGLTVLAWSALAIGFVLTLGPTLGVRAVAYAVAGWLAGVGLTDMVLARRVVLAPAEERTSTMMGLVLVVAATAGVAHLVRPLIDRLATALVGLASVGLVALGVGFFVILTRGDRALIVRQLADLLPLGRLRVATATDSHRPTDP